MDIEKFLALGKRAQDIAIANLKKDEDYDDAPDEFIGEKSLAISSSNILVWLLVFKVNQNNSYDFDLGDEKPPSAYNKSKVDLKPYSFFLGLTSGRAIDIVITRNIHSD